MEGNDPIPCFPDQRCSQGCWNKHYCFLGKQRNTPLARAVFEALYFHVNVRNECRQSGKN